MTSDPGSVPSVVVHIADGVVATIAAHAVRDEPHVHGLQTSIMRSLPLRRSADPADGVRVETSRDGTARIEVDVVLELGSPLPAVARRIQTQVADRVAATTGLRAVVTVNIVDVSGESGDSQ